MRKPSNYGLKMTTKVTCSLIKKGYTIISGMALGVDAISHRTAIYNGGKTIAVLGSGINYPYPKRNRDIYDVLKENHLVISEYPGSLPPKKEYFPIRNRLIAGLSKRLLVTEAKLKSGTMITVNYALNQGKDVYAVPSSLDSENIGCNHLIQLGASLFLNVDDLT